VTVSRAQAWNATFGLLKEGLSPRDLSPEHFAELVSLPSDIRDQLALEERAQGWSEFSGKAAGQVVSNIAQGSYEFVQERVQAVFAVIEAAIERRDQGPVRSQLSMLSSTAARLLKRIEGRADGPMRNEFLGTLATLELACSQAVANGLEELAKEPLLRSDELRKRLADEDALSTFSQGAISVWVGAQFAQFSEPDAWRSLLALSDRPELLERAASQLAQGDVSDRVGLRVGLRSIALRSKDALQRALLVADRVAVVEEGLDVRLGLASHPVLERLFRAAREPVTIELATGESLSGLLSRIRDRDPAKAGDTISVTLGEPPRSVSLTEVRKISQGDRVLFDAQLDPAIVPTQLDQPSKVEAKLLKIADAANLMPVSTVDRHALNDLFVQLAPHLSAERLEQWKTAVRAADERAPGGDALLRFVLAKSVAETFEPLLEQRLTPAARASVVDLSIVAAFMGSVRATDRATGLGRFLLEGRELTPEQKALVEAYDYDVFQLVRHDTVGITAKLLEASRAALQTQTAERLEQFPALSPRDKALAIELKLPGADDLAVLQPPAEKDEYMRGWAVAYRRAGVPVNLHLGEKTALDIAGQSSELLERAVALGKLARPTQSGDLGVAALNALSTMTPESVEWWLSCREEDLQLLATRILSKDLLDGMRNFGSERAARELIAMNPRLQERLFWIFENLPPGSGLEALAREIVNPGESTRRMLRSERLSLEA
jgi:hypothetical protein